MRICPTMTNVLLGIEQASFTRRSRFLLDKNLKLLCSQIFFSQRGLDCYFVRDITWTWQIMSNNLIFTKPIYRHLAC